MPGKNAFYLLFVYEQLTADIPFYSNSAAFATVDINLIINQLKDIYVFFDYESYRVFYDKKNLDSFFKTIKVDGKVGKRAFSRLLNNKLNASNWNVRKSFAGSTRMGGIKLVGETFSYLARLRSVNPSGVNAILDMGAMNGTYSGCGVEVLDPTIPAVHDWFSRNRVPRRQYHLSPKHGECGVSNWVGESVLLGSRKEAEQLLHEAIGTKDMRDLYCFDKKYGKYMRFMSENVANTYHSFHIDSKDIDPGKRSIILNKLAKV